MVDIRADSTRAGLYESGSKHELYARKIAFFLDIPFLCPAHLHQRWNGGGAFGNADVAEHKGRPINWLFGQ